MCSCSGVTGKGNGGGLVVGCVCVVYLQHCGSLCPVTSCSLTLVAAGGPGYSNVVDLYNSTTGAWSTAFQLSVARGGVAATSVGNLALFAGGEQEGGLLRRECVMSGEGGWC